jgi:SAM-dependent methyltransferase
MSLNDSPACPLCRNISNRLFEARGYWIRSCSACHHQFAEIEPSATPASHAATIYSDAYFTKGSDAGYTDYLAESEILRARGQHYANLLRPHIEPGKVLDVGCAAGFTLAGFRAAGWEGQGIEPNDTMAAWGRNQLGLDIRTGTLEELGPCLGSFDLVSMIQIFPHFIHPRTALAVVRRVLRPGGLLLIETWDRESYARKLFGASWHEYAPPSVLHWFSRQGLAEFNANHDFVHLKSGRPPKWIQVGHALSAAKSATPNPLMRSLLGIADALTPARLALPYPGDDIFYSIFRNGQLLTEVRS